MGHMSYRFARIPWTHHHLELFIAGGLSPEPHPEQVLLSCRWCPQRDGLAALLAFPNLRKPVLQ